MIIFALYILSKIIILSVLLFFFRAVSFSIGVLLVIGVYSVFNQWTYLDSGTPKKRTFDESFDNGDEAFAMVNAEPELVKNFLLEEADAKNQPLDSPLMHSDSNIHQKDVNSYYRRIAFLKVHKAGSSTAQNIFLRYGESRNLTFLLSKVRKRQWDNVISVDSTLNRDNTMPPPENKTFDVLCCHVLYDNFAWKKYMPADTAYIGITREPFEQFLSTLNYFNPLRRITSYNKVLEYLKKPQAYEKGVSPRKSLTNNRMAAEFGFPLKLFNQYSKSESNNYLDKLDKEFQFVIIMDYFIESIVMMRRVLGWEIKDVLYLKKNAARKAYHFVDYTHRYLYEDFAKLDYDLYNHFFKRLWDQIRDEGPDFHEELLYFSRLRKEVEDYCLHQAKRNDEFKVNQSKWGDEFLVTLTDCKYLRMHESTFVKNIRNRQYG